MAFLLEQGKNIEKINMYKKTILVLLAAFVLLCWCKSRITRKRYPFYCYC